VTAGGGSVAPRALDASDIEVVNATIADFSGANADGEGSTYTFNLLPGADGLISARLPAGVARVFVPASKKGESPQELKNIVSNTLTIMLDRIAPTVAVTGPSVATGDSSTEFEWVVSYTGADIIGLALADIDVITTGDVSCGDLTIGVGGSSSSRIVTVGACTGDGTVTIEIAAHTARDYAGNQAAADSTAIAATVDNSGGGGSPPSGFVAFDYPDAGAEVLKSVTDFEVFGSCDDDDDGRAITFSPAASAAVVCSSGYWSATFDVSAHVGASVSIEATLVDSGGDSHVASRMFMVSEPYRVVEVVGNRNAFAALRSDGSVVSWGDYFSGGEVPSVLSAADAGVVTVAGTGSTFTALRSDGSVINWGTSSDEFVSSDGIEIASSRLGGAFAVLKSDGTVSSWNSYDEDEAPASVTDPGSDVVKVFSNGAALVALKSNGSLVAWGDPAAGGTTPAGVDEDVVKVFSNNLAFAALKSDGSVVAWGNSSYGGSGVPAGASSGVVEIVSNDLAFAARKSDGSVLAWGDATLTASIPASVTTPGSNVSRVYGGCGGGRFVALKSDGSVVSWGGAGCSISGITFKD
jgi:hypothetical protein